MITTLVDLISAHVVAALAAASYQPLTDGKILLGRRFQYVRSAPPRIIFIPTKNDFDASNAYGPGTAPLAAKNPNILTDKISFECRCWAITAGANPLNPDTDFNYTQTLYRQVVRSCLELALGSVTFSSGTWENSKSQATQEIVDGMEHVMMLTFDTPIVRFLEALPNAPGDVSPGITDTFSLPNGQSGPGCEE